MKLDGLKNFYKSMKKQDIERIKFDFIFNNIKFDVLYFIDEKPNILAFGIKQHNYYFEISVENGFVIKPFLDDYSKFCKIMGFEYNPEKPFKPSYFFKHFNNQVPNKAKVSSIPQPSEVAAYRNNVEEAEKIYFVRWRDNNKIGQQVSGSNLEKTRKLISYNAYMMSKEQNISSCWSSNPSNQKKYKLPKLKK